MNLLAAANFENDAPHNEIPARPQTPDPYSSPNVGRAREDLFDDVLSEVPDHDHDPESYAVRANRRVFIPPMMAPPVLYGRSYEPDAITTEEYRSRCKHVYSQVGRAAVYRVDQDVITNYANGDGGYKPWKVRVSDRYRSRKDEPRQCAPSPLRREVDIESCVPTLAMPLNVLDSSWVPAAPLEIVDEEDEEDELVSPMATPLDVLNSPWVPAAPLEMVVEEEEEDELKDEGNVDQDSQRDISPVPAKTDDLAKLRQAIAIAANLPASWSRPLTDWADDEDEDEDEDDVNEEMGVAKEVVPPSIAEEEVGTRAAIEVAVLMASDEARDDELDEELGNDESTACSQDLDVAKGVGVPNEDEDYCEVIEAAILMAASKPAYDDSLDELIEDKDDAASPQELDIGKEVEVPSEGDDHRAAIEAAILMASEDAYDYHLNEVSESNESAAMSLKESISIFEEDVGDMPVSTSSQEHDDFFDDLYPEEEVVDEQQSQPLDISGHDYGAELVIPQKSDKEPENLAVPENKSPTLAVPGIPESVQNLIADQDQSNHDTETIRSPLATLGLPASLEARFECEPLRRQPLAKDLEQTRCPLATLGLPASLKAIFEYQPWSHVFQGGAHDTLPEVPPEAILQPEEVRMSKWKKWMATLRNKAQYVRAVRCFEHNRVPRRLQRKRDAAKRSAEPKQIVVGIDELLADLKAPEDAEKYAISDVAQPLVPSIEALMARLIVAEEPEEPVKQEIPTESKRTHRNKSMFRKLFKKSKVLQKIGALPCFA